MTLVLFIRDSGGLEHACRQAAALLSFRQRLRSRTSVNDVVPAVWMHPAMTRALWRLSVRLGEGTGCVLTACESFGLCGVWEFVRLEPVERFDSDLPSGLFHDALVDGLIAMAGSESPAATGLYAPVFPQDTPRAWRHVQFERLAQRYPQRIADAIVHDRKRGSLTIDEELQQ